MKYSATTLRSVFLLSACLILLPSMAAAETKRRACGTSPGQALQHFIDEVNPGDTLVVSGTCNANVLISEAKSNLVIDGQGTAIIDGSGNANAPAVHIRGRSISIKGFIIVGGRSGVQLSGGASARIDGNRISGAVAHGVGLHNNSFAQVVDNTIEQNGANGICICEHSAADIGFRGDIAAQASPNIVRNNGTNGILVADASHGEIEGNSVYGNAGAGVHVDDNSSAKIGFISGVTGTFAGANTIEMNGNRGVLVSRSSNARIVENVIRNNSGDGVAVIRVSQADIAGNAIDGNSRHGIFVNQNSGVNLGNDAGSGPQDQPNRTTVKNAGFGISCSINASADGRQGSLNGNAGPQEFSGSCANSLNP